MPEKLPLRAVPPNKVAITRAIGKNKDVSIQDQATSPLILPAVYELGTSSLAVSSVTNERTIQVVSSTGMTVGNHLRIINAAADRYYFGTILAINSNVITLDNLIDFAYVAGSEVTYSTVNMAVDGSVTPVHFHLRTGSPSIPSSVDITRILMTCECSDAVDLNKFADITGGLTRGLLFRYSNSTIHNIFNIKTNRDMALMGYDWTPYTSSNPALGINGFSWRLTFNGQEKMGVVLRITQDGQLGIIVQDDLTSLTSLTLMFEGHIVQE